MFRIALLAMILVIPSVQGDETPTLKVPPETRIKQGKLGKVTVETTGKFVKWVALTPGLDFSTCTPDGKTITFTGLPGKYELLVYTALGDVPSDPVRTVVIVDSSTPEPEPVTPPVPSKELTAKIKEAVEQDKGEKADMVQLAALYREAAKISVKKVEGKYDVPSSKELLRRVRESSAALIGTDVLTNVRTVAAGELAGALGMPSDDNLTDFQRRSVADTFLKLAIAIESLYP